MHCPYPGCGGSLAMPDMPECECEERNPLLVCSSCRLPCRSNARYCRACGAPLPEKPSAISKPSGLLGPDFLFISGAFYRGPVESGGFLWSLSQQGEVSRLSPRRDARPRAVGTLPSAAAGLNHYALVSIYAAGSAVVGPALVAADPAGVHAISLLDGRVQTLFTSTSSAAIDVNSSVEESPYFRGVCAGTDFYSFVIRRGTDAESSLVVRYFTRGRAGEEPVLFERGAYIGPVANGTSVGICTRANLWVYDTLDQTVHAFALPPGFDPYVQRPSTGIRVPPGHVPFVLNQSEAGLEAWIAGEQRGRPGVLQVDPGRHACHFYDADAGNSLSELETGALGLNRGEGVEIFGGAPPPGRMTGLEPSMPIAMSSSWFVHFRRRQAPGRHVLSAFTDVAEPLSTSFDDPACDEDSCCGMHVIDGRHLLVSYWCLPRAGNRERGLRFAHWTIQ